jgi:hypothetical protein
VIVSAVAAAIDVQDPPVGPALNTRLTFDCAGAGAADSAVSSAVRVSSSGMRLASISWFSTNRRSAAGVLGSEAA